MQIPGLLEPYPLVVERRFAVLASLSAAEGEILSMTGRAPVKFRAGEKIESEGAPQPFPRTIVSGWAYQSRILANGSKQVFGFLTPGDLIGMSGRPELPRISNVIALTRVTLGDARPLMAALNSAGEHPALAQACAAASHIEQILMFNQIMRLGSQSAYERLAHLLLELYWRLNVVGLASDWRFDMPITQDMLGDTLGLSVVHINRTIQHLRRDKMIELAGGRVHLLDPDTLTHLSNYKTPRFA